MPSKDNLYRKDVTDFQSHVKEIKWLRIKAFNPPNASMTRGTQLPESIEVSMKAGLVWMNESPWNLRDDSHGFRLSSIDTDASHRSNNVEVAEAEQCDAHTG